MQIPLTGALIASQAKDTSPEETSAIAAASLQLKKRYTALSRLAEDSQRNRLRAFLLAAFLVAVPVFIQAPLVRIAPMLSFLMTGAWLALGYRWINDTDAHHPNRKLWGDLIVGFSWTWLAGSVYWGWFRTNPYIHLPIESIALPIVLALMFYNRSKIDKYNIGNYFYIGSLLGTAITDIYFYCVGLIPYWQQLMISPPEEAGTILHSALLRMSTYEGVGYAIVLLTLLVMLGTIPMRSHRTKWWAFSGAILSTILVDSLFFVAAILS